jgi:hypothetical protein
MLRDNLVGLIEPMRISAGADPLALSIQNQASDDRPSCLENPRPEGAESSLTENVTSPFQTEPAHFGSPSGSGRTARFSVASASLEVRGSARSRASRFSMDAEYITSRRQVERREPLLHRGQIDLGGRRSVAEQGIRRHAIMNDVNGA